MHTYIANYYYVPALGWNALDTNILTFTEIGNVLKPVTVTFSIA